MSKPKTPKRGRVRLQPYVKADIALRISELCAARGMTETAIIEEALTQYVEGTGDATLYMRRLDRLGRELKRNHRELELLSESFSIWTKLWFAHTPSIPDEAKQTARSNAETRHRQFVEHVAQQFSAGRRFVDELPRDVTSDVAMAPPDREK